MHAWLAAQDIQEDFILMMDGDMVLRKSLDQIALGAARGRVVSAEYTYLVGTTSGFAEHFIPQYLIPRLAQVGGFHIFHKEDLRLIAPLWLEYTKKVRAFAHKDLDTFFHESMHIPADTPPETVAVRKKQVRGACHAVGGKACVEVGDPTDQREALRVRTRPRLHRHDSAG